MPVVDAIAEAVAYRESPPPNEAATCLWVIYPLLRAIGYAPLEIQPEGNDTNGQYPDYTILPNNPACWYLEAKAWKVGLQDHHAHQSLNYANHNGKRWVVLTNGRIWRLYDNQVQGVASDKLVVEVRLEEFPAAEEFLQALSKPAVTTGLLDQYANRARLSRLLRIGLRDQNSGVVKALWSYVRKEPGLGDISRADIAGFFANYLTPALPSSGQPEPAPASEQDGGAADAGDKQTEDPAGDGKIGLDQLPGHVTGRKPAELTLPNGNRVAVVSWRELALAVVKWVVDQGSLPHIPFAGGKSGKRYFLNHAPEHQHGPMLDHAAVPSNGGTVYVDLHRSAIDLVTRLCLLCQAANLPPSSFLVSFA